MATAVTSPLTSSAPRSRRGLHIGLWVVQALLGVAFGFAGFTKLTAPFESLNQMMPWTAVVGEGMTRFIGLSELAGAIGVVLPALTRVRPSLTALAGAGLATVMVLASLFHATRSEWQVIPINFVLGSLAAFVAWGRFRAVPIAPRTSERAP